MLPVKNFEKNQMSVKYILNSDHIGLISSFLDEWQRKDTRAKLEGAASFIAPHRLSGLGKLLSISQDLLPSSDWGDGVSDDTQVSSECVVFSWLLWLPGEGFWDHVQTHLWRASWMMSHFCQMHRKKERWHEWRCPLRSRWAIKFREFRIQENTSETCRALLSFPTTFACIVLLICRSAHWQRRLVNHMLGAYIVCDLI